MWGIVCYTPNLLTTTFKAPCHFWVTSSDRGTDVADRYNMQRGAAVTAVTQDRKSDLNTRSTRGCHTSKCLPPQSSLYANAKHAAGLKAQI